MRGMFATVTLSPPHRVTLSFADLAKHRRHSRLDLRSGLPFRTRDRSGRSRRGGPFWHELLRSRIRCWSRSRRAAHRARRLNRHRLRPSSIPKRLNPVLDVGGLMVMDRRVAVVPTTVIATMPVAHMPLRRHWRWRQTICRLPVRNLLVGVTELRRVGRRINLRVAAILTRSR